SGLHRLGRFPLRQIEHERVELGQALGGQRAAVRAREVLEHPALASGVVQREPVLLLVAPELLDQAQALVDRLDERPVDLGDLLAELVEDRIVSHRGSAAGYEPKTCSCRVCARTSASASLIHGSSGWPARTAWKQ